MVIFCTAAYHLKVGSCPSAISYPESSGFLVSGATPGRLWGHQILLPQDFCGKTMETVTEQPIKKIEFFRCPQSLPGVAPLTKKPEDSGYEIGPSAKFNVQTRMHCAASISHSAESISHSAP